MARPRRRRGHGGLRPRQSSGGDSRRPKTLSAIGNCSTINTSASGWPTSGPGVRRQSSKRSIRRPSLPSDCSKLACRSGPLTCEAIPRFAPNGRRNFWISWKFISIPVWRGMSIEKSNATSPVWRASCERWPRGQAGGRGRVRLLRRGNRRNAAIDFTARHRGAAGAVVPQVDRNLSGLCRRMAQLGTLRSSRGQRLRQRSGLLTVDGKLKVWGSEFQELAKSLAVEDFSRPPKLGPRPALDWDACLTSSAAQLRFREEYDKAFEANH